MVFCLENEMPHRLLGSAMVHFHASEVQQLLHNKFVVILGDSIQRAVYKDLVLLLQKDTLLTASQLKAKGELSFEQDQLVAGGQLGELHNGTQYREVRQFCSGSGHHLVRFYFLTRVYSEYLEDILEELSYGPAPDLVIINSCLWDLSRYGRCSMESYRENLERVFVRMDQVLPDSCLLVWNLAMPLGERVTGGFLLPELQPLAVSLRQDVVEGNFYSATLAGKHCFDVLDLHFHFRHAVRHRHRDGVHWDQHAHRHLSHLLLAHVADAWGVELPEHDRLPETSERHVRLRVIKKKKIVVKKRKKLRQPGPLGTARPLVTTHSAKTLTLPEKQEPGCPPLGLESLRVSDSQLEASSSQSFGLGAHRGRLNIQSGLEDGDLYDGAWCAEQQDTEPWLQVDAKNPVCFAGIVTQGRNSVWRYDWVTSFKVQFSNDSQTWWKSRNSTGMDMVFPANSDAETPVLNLLPEPQVARFIRLLPQTWFQGGAPCLRAEILACPVSDPNDLFPEAHTLGSSDSLDFRHHNYKAMRKLMKQVNEQCPNITRIYSIGKSHQGLKLYVMEMSDHPGEHELGTVWWHGKRWAQGRRWCELTLSLRVFSGEPEVRYVAGMHGNEALGRELLLLLMQFLCHEFLRGDPRVTRLLTETRIHLLPSMNPDGYETAYHRGSELVGWAEGRWTHQGIDLNHNFADLNTQLWYAEDDGLVPHTVPNHHLPLPTYYTLPNATVAPETWAVIKWMKRIPFVLSANLHGGELVVSYPFDMTRTPWAARELTPTPDDAVFRWLSTVYAGTNRAMQDTDRRPCHSQDFSLHGNVINGADWHTVPGSMNDFSYLHTNCFEVTVELSCDKFPHEKELPQEWENNKDALLTYLEQVRMGITGVVRDKDTELGIADAVIAVEGINHDVTTAWGGDYWRLLTPGDYVVTASAEGYHTVRQHCQVTFEEGPVPCNFLLTKTPKERLRELLATRGKLPPDLRRKLERLRGQK